MTDYPLDIIIPVWNNPVEVRAALASFAAGTPLARLVMVNNGSERETEAILHEFAEALDSRALLLSTGRNIGTVAALNLGLARSTAAFAMVTNPFIRLPSGWFDEISPVFTQADAVGAVCLRSCAGITTETDYGSFAAMVLRRELLLCVAGFDQDMDAAVWTLRDFARKTTASGYRMVSVCNRQLQELPQQELGSQVRREQRVSAARKLYADRWGEPGNYLIICTDDAVPWQSSAVLRDTLLAAARQGDRLTVAATSKAARLLSQEGFGALHENINFLSLPRFFADRALRRAVEQLAHTDAAALLIADDVTPFPLNRISRADFAARIRSRQERFYRGGDHA